MKLVDGNLNSANYQTMLEENLIPSVKQKCGKIGLLQDNAPCHNSSSTKAWLAHKKIDFLPHPSRSPDLNIMENVFGWMARGIYENGTQFSSLQELKTALTSCFNTLPASVCKKCIISMPDRLCDILLKNGSHTRF